MRTFLELTLGAINQTTKQQRRGSHTGYASNENNIGKKLKLTTSNKRKRIISLQDRGRKAKRKEC